MLELLKVFGAPCGGGNFLGLPKWHKYLEGEGSGADCSPVLSELSDIWLILLAISELLLRVAIIVAIVFVLYGGIKYINARGNSDKLTNAKNTVTDGLVGLVIAISATAVVAFVARSISG